MFDIEESIRENDKVTLVFHIHPKGKLGEDTAPRADSAAGTTLSSGNEKSFAQFVQLPSAGDIANIKSYLESYPDIEYGIVIGARSRYAYFYTDKGTIAKLPLGVFFRE
jgi:hypothetical protein